MTLTNDVKVYWRFRKDAPCAWREGWPTRLPDGLVRMGFYIQAPTGLTVTEDEIEWKKA